MTANRHTFIEIAAHDSIVGFSSRNIDRAVFVLYCLLCKEIKAKCIRADKGLVIILKRLIVSFSYLIYICFNLDIINSE